MLALSHCIFVQHLKGDKNTVADLLSFLCQNCKGTKQNPIAHDCPNNAKLTQRFHKYVPQLIPLGFQISRLPKNILSFAMQALQTLKLSMIQLENQRMKEKTGHGGDRNHFVPAQEFVTCYSIQLHPKRPNYSFHCSLPALAQLNGTSQENFLVALNGSYKQQLYKLPQATWLRRFRSVLNRFPFTTSTAQRFSHP